MAKRKGKRTTKVVVQTLSTNVKTGSNNKKNKKKNSRRRRQMGGVYVSNDRLIRAICALVDPFCPASSNCMYPDDTSAKVVTERIVSTIQINSNASGGNMVAFVPNPLFPYLVAASGGPPTWTMANTFTAGADSLYKNQGNEFRIVNWGVKLINVQSLVNTQGYLSIGVVDMIPYGTTISSGTTNFMHYEVMPIKHAGEFCWVSRPLGKEARTFANYPTNTNWGDGWEGLIVELFGTLPTSTPIIAEIVFNIEFNIGKQFGVGNGIVSPYAKLARDRPPANNLLTSAADAVYSKMNTIIQGGVKVAEQTFYNKAGRIVAGIGTAAASAIGGRLMGPLRAIGAAGALMNDIQNVD